MIETREQETRAQELAAEYPHGVGVKSIAYAYGGDGLSPGSVGLYTCHDAQARPVHREIVLPDGTRFVEAREPALDALLNRADRVKLAQAGYFPWGHDSWIQEDDLGMVFSTQAALALVEDEHASEHPAETLEPQGDDG